MMAKLEHGISGSRTIDISIILPAFNEEANIPSAILEAEKVAESLGLSFEIIVVDDGSHDQTVSLAQKNQSPRVIIVSHKQNRGYGAALRSGIEASSGNLIFFTDSDRQFDLQQLNLLLPWLKFYDVVAGYRANRADDFSRRLNAKIWALYMKLLFGLDVEDIDCAFKIFKREVFEKIPINSIGAFINTEIFLRAKKEGFTIKQVPVRHFSRKAGKQTGASVKVIFKAIWESTKFVGKL